LTGGALICNVKNISLVGLKRGGPTAYAENLILFDFIQQHYTVQSYECNELKYINVNNK